MFIKTTQQFSLCFGNKTHQFIPNCYTKTTLLEQEPFCTLKNVLQLQQLFFLKQIHSNRGLCLSAENSTHASFMYEGDYLLTDIRQLGIGVVTADCLPIIIIDTAHPAVCIIHAGWRGSIASITSKAFAHMQQLFGTTHTNVAIFFGPSAKACCYTIGMDVKNALEAVEPRAIQQHNQQIYGDIPLLNALQLQQLGIDPKNIDCSYNLCTLCNPMFCSYRRDKNALRQMSIVMINR